MSKCLMYKSNFEDWFLDKKKSSNNFVSLKCKYNGKDHEQTLASKIYYMN